MTCKDCLYYEVCADFRRNICETDQKRFEEYRLNSDGLCDNFKDKSRYVELPCKVGDTVYVIEPLWYGIWGDDEHKCRKCWYFYEGGMGDPPGCELEDDCCYHIVETKADLRHIADWIIQSMFVGEIAWGKTVFLTREEAEKALAERSRE